MHGGSVSIQQSRNLPHWLWITIAKSLGIKLKENDRPILATIFSFLTFISGLGFVISTFWFTVYDIISDYTKTTVIDGSVNIIYTGLWGALGIYAHKLSRRLFSHAHFAKLVKLHSKTILKMNAAVLLFLLMTLFIVINDVNGYRGYKSSICQTGVKAVVCHLRFFFRVVFSAFALLWNYLVAFAIISVCRSHVIRLRKFMRVLQEDSASYELSFLGLSASSSASETALLEEYLWVEENYLEELHDAEESDVYHQQKADPSSSPNVGSDVISDSCPLTSNPNPASAAVCEEGLSHDTRPLKRRRPTPCLSNDEILFNYWKIQTDVRISSVALQRWMVSVISLVAIWLAMNLVLWLNYDPDLVDLVNFLLPLLLLPLLSSAYAEVNQEGQRLLKFICLTEERLQLLLALHESPLQMTVYSYDLSYKTIATASFGVLLALASKILIQKVLK